MKKGTNLSPYILCRFRLGLLIGVRSLMAFLSSTLFKASLRALASIGSEPARSIFCAKFPFTPLFFSVGSGDFSVSGSVA